MKKAPRIYKQWETPDYQTIKDFGPSQADESQLESTDINNILKRYQKTGLLAHAIEMEPQYGDFSESTDYQAAMQTIATANQQFELLPANLRERFQNNPAKMLEFVANKENKEEAIKLGIIPQPKKEAIKDSKMAQVEQKDSTLTQE